MKLDDFDYQLPRDLIAQYPQHPRGESRLMHLDCVNQSISDHYFSDLTELLNPGDLLILNDTQVIPARLYGQKETGGQVEILLERILSETDFLAQIRASKPPKDGTKIMVDSQPLLKVLNRKQDLFHVRSFGQENLLWLLNLHGRIPLPPYIERDDETLDQVRYQTVYACHPGSVAAPTAGLHFTHEQLNELARQGIGNVAITLHIGAGTFQPVRVTNISEHKMHHEYYELLDHVVQAISKTKKNGGRIIAVGTTSLRSLETAIQRGRLEGHTGKTNLFIYPGYKFRVVDGLITNFHLPRSTLLMLVSAFAGMKFIRCAYQRAIVQRYHFFSYGDAMFISR